MKKLFNETDRTKMEELKNVEEKYDFLLIIIEHEVK